MNSTFRITYTNESGCPCCALIHDKYYYYWSSHPDKFTGKYYKVRKTIVGKFISKLGNCKNVVVEEINN